MLTWTATRMPTIIDKCFILLPTPQFLRLRGSTLGNFDISDVALCVPAFLYPAAIGEWDCRDVSESEKDSSYLMCASIWVCSLYTERRTGVRPHFPTTYSNVIRMSHTNVVWSVFGLQMKTNASSSCNWVNEEEWARKTACEAAVFQIQRKSTPIGTPDWKQRIFAHVWNIWKSNRNSLFVRHRYSSIYRMWMLREASSAEKELLSHSITARRGQFHSLLCEIAVVKLCAGFN